MRQAYICGHYTSPTEEGTRAHIRAALGYAHSLTLAGWNVIVPHVMGPHRADWETAMIRCRELIRGLDPRTDALITLPGWTDSKGACEEVAMAHKAGLAVMTVYEAMSMEARA